MDFLIILYLLAVGLATQLAYNQFNQRWRLRERARTVVGVMVVFVPVAPLALADLVDIEAVITLFCGFGVAGAITLYRDIEAATEGANAIRDQILQD